MSSLFKRFGCMIRRHSPLRRSVRYVGHLKVGPCKNCGAELEKSADGSWIKRRELGIKADG